MIWSKIGKSVVFRFGNLELLPERLGDTLVDDEECGAAGALAAITVDDGEGFAHERHSTLEADTLVDDPPFQRIYPVEGGTVIRGK